MIWVPTLKSVRSYSAPIALSTSLFPSSLKVIVPTVIWDWPSHTVAEILFAVPSTGFSSKSEFNLISVGVFLVTLNFVVFKTSSPNFKVAVYKSLAFKTPKSIVSVPASANVFVNGLSMSLITIVYSPAWATVIVAIECSP